MKVQNREEIAAEVKALRDKKKAEREKKGREKKGWYGLIYCDDGGQCSVADFINGEQKIICLGKTDEIIPYLKKQEINGENLNSVLAAVEDFRTEKKEGEILHKDFLKPTVSKTQSCHSNTKNEKTYIPIPPPKSHRATSEDNPPNLASQHPFFKKDPKLFNLLKSLTDRDIGTPTIHRELNEQGYAIPYRTVGRWVAQMRTGQLL